MSIPFNEYISSSSSSYRAGSTDIPDPLSPLLPIVHRPRYSATGNDMHKNMLKKHVNTIQ